MNSCKWCMFRRYTRRIVIDLALIPLAFYLALLLRFEGHVPSQDLATLSRFVLPIVLVYIAVNLIFGIYRRLWTYTSFRDVILLSETVALGTLILIVINELVLPHRIDQRLSLCVLVMGGMFTLLGSIIAKYRLQFITLLTASWFHSSQPSSERLLIVGLNETAQQLATQVYLGRCETDYELVGCVNNNPDDRGMNNSGVRILGTLDQIPKIVSDQRIDVIAITAWPSNREEMWQLVSTCQKTCAKIKVLPNITEVLEGFFQDPFTLRDLNVEDVLGRAPVMVNERICEETLSGKVILVSGAAGSIGSELCRQILRFKPRLLLTLDNNETGLYELNLKLDRNGGTPIQLVMADVTDWRKVSRVFEKYEPQVVFHTAAYKHVHLVECSPDEALRVNVIGTVIMSQVAHECNVERFVFISTDKAVNPTSVMGSSKRVGELWIKSLAKKSQTLFSIVRFGNVVGSRGSVVPTFAKQIEQGGPVTVTHPEMTRFFMSIPEAASLVLQAAAFSKGNELFMLEMGEQVSILDLAHRMIRMKGLRIDKDVAVKYVGVRPGEKLHEELSYGQEIKKGTVHPSIYQLQSLEEPLDYHVLLGAIMILNQALRLSEGEQLVRNGIFYIAAREIDACLDEVTGMDSKGVALSPVDDAKPIKEVGGFALQYRGRSLKGLPLPSA